MYSVILFAGILSSVYGQYGYGGGYGGGGGGYGGCCASLPNTATCCPDPCCIPEVTVLPCCHYGGYKPHHRRIKGTKIVAHFTLPDEDFAPALEDRESMGFKELATKIANAIATLYEGDYSFKGVKILKFENANPGVVVHFVIKLATGYKYENEIVNSAKNKLEDAVEAGIVGGLKADNSSLSIDDVDRGVYIYPYHQHQYHAPPPYYHYYLKKFTTPTPPPTPTP